MLTPVLLAAAGSVFGQGFDFQFNAGGVLPGSQGAAFKGSGGAKEPSVYSVKDGYLPETPWEPARQPITSWTPP